MKVSNDMLRALYALPERRSGSQKIKLNAAQEATARDFFAHRKEKGWALDEVARIIGIHSATLRRIGREWGLM